MCVYNRKRWWQMYGKVGIETDAVYVEERDKCFVCVCLELDEELRYNWCGCDYECVRFENVGLSEP